MKAMTKAGLILVSISLLVAVATLAATATAQCASCNGEEDWTASANSFLEGKPVSETPPLWGPAAERQKNSQFDKSATASAADAAKTAQTQAFSIDLKSASALPISAAAGGPVKIAAVFGITGSIPSGNESESGNASASGNQMPLTAEAVIKNQSGAEVGRVNLIQATGGEYTGIWNADVAVGVYMITLVASTPQESRTFDDALQIEVIVESAAPGTAPVE
jgi:hypothetical protein